MAVLKGISRSKRSEALSKSIMVDTTRGVLRVRAWPKKYGKARSALQQYWIDWFTQANRLAKYADEMSLRRAIEITANSGMYPRDIILSAMRGRLYTWVDQTGKQWHPMAAVQDISESLDVLTQTVGAVLVRAADRWRDAENGQAGRVLTHQGPGNAPAWATPAGGGGYLGGALCQKTVNQNVPNVSWTPLSFVTEEYDTAGIHDNSVNPTRFTVPVGFNRVQLNGGVHWPTNATKSRIIRFWKNGAVIPGCPEHRARAVQYIGSASFLNSPVLECSPGDYFEIVAYQDSGSTLQAIATSSCCFSIELKSAV